MSVKVTSKVNVKALVEKRIEKKAFVFEQAVSDEVTELGIRTDRGIDVDGAGFVGYEESTIKQKRRKGSQVNPVNLTDTGEMLGGINTEFSGNKREARIAFADKRNAIAAFWTNQKRNWFALSKDQIEKIKNKVRES